MQYVQLCVLIIFATILLEICCDCQNNCNGNNNCNNKCNKCNNCYNCNNCNSCDNCNKCQNNCNSNNCENGCVETSSKCNNNCQNRENKQKHNSSSVIKTGNISDNKHNVTTIINIKNIINNTNQIEIPVKVNSTNFNDIKLNNQEHLQGWNQQQPQRYGSCCHITRPNGCQNNGNCGIYNQFMPLFAPPVQFRPRPPVVCLPNPCFPNPCPFPFSNSTNCTILFPSFNQTNNTLPPRQQFYPIRNPRPAIVPQLPQPIPIPIRPVYPKVPIPYVIPQPIPIPPPQFSPPKQIPLPPIPNRPLQPIINPPRLYPNCHFVHHYPWIQCRYHQNQYCQNCYCEETNYNSDICVRQCSVICKQAMAKNTPSDIKCQMVNGRLRCSKNF